MNTRKWVIAGVLSALSVLLGVTGLGFVPVPTAVGNATILQIPAIIGGVLEGPIVGAIIGTIFGISSFLHATIPIFKDPLVAILPRIFIGIGAYYVYKGLRPINHYLAIGVSGCIGSLVNTVFVLTMIYVRHYLSLAACVTAAVVNGIPEAIVSTIITLAVVSAWLRLDPRRRQSRI